MKLDTITIIKMLPLEPAFREKLLERYNTMGPDEKVRVRRIIWDAYDEMVTSRIDAKVQLELSAVLADKAKLDGHTYERAKEAVTKELTDESIQKSQESDLSSIRNKLQELTNPSQ